MEWRNRRYCSQITLADRDQSVLLFGWVDTVRDHGQLLFIHLRDISGVVQVVFDPQKHADFYAEAQRLRSEFVVQIEGTVFERAEDTKNKNLSTGDIEILATRLEILNNAEPPPFLISEKEIMEQNPIQVDEEIRLKYRYLDLRRIPMQQNMIKRYKILKLMRDYLDQKGFIEIETPYLTKSTPEGARDYLVPSRVHENQFYALPQSPQLFKQLLMISGFDRYFQVAKCFRDEDLRPNRQPEFTQLDLEASFIDESFMYELIEGLIGAVLKSEQINLTPPFPHISYDDAMNRYGSDAPDLRFGLELVDVTVVFKDTQYKIFRSVLDANGVIKGFNIKGQADVLTKNLLQNEWAMSTIQKMGAKGMTWMKVIDGTLQSNIVQFFSEAEQRQLMDAMHAENGDVLIFIADSPLKKVNEILGRFRLFVAEYLNWIDPNQFAACWVTDFPLFERKQGKIEAVHHPFTQGNQNLLELTEDADILNVKARAYDLVINGNEIGGGSIRNHNLKVQERVFEILGFTEAEIQEKFGFFIQAFKYGAPPHGGLALGVDRLVSIILKTQSIREVIAFPKNRMALCPMSKAPSFVDAHQLEELNLIFHKSLK